MLDLKKIAQSIFRSGKKPDDKRASKIVNDTWFAAALFHDIGLLGGRLGDIVIECNKLLSLYPSVKLRIKEDYNSSEIIEELKEIYNEIYGSSGSSLGTWFGHHKDKTRDNIDHGLLSAATIIKRFKVKKDYQRISHAAFAVAIHNLAHSVDKEMKGLEMPHIKFYDYPIAAMLLICEQLQVWGRNTGLENFTNKLDFESIELNEVRYNKNEKKLYVLINYYPYRYALASEHTMTELGKGLRKVYRKKILPTLERIEKDEKDQFKMDVRVLLNGRDKIMEWKI